MKITNVLDNNEKKKTYSFLCKKCKEEMCNNNYEAVLVLSYAMIEDRLKSFLHYLFVIDKDKGILYPTDEVDIIIRPLCHFKSDSEKFKVYKLNSLSSKLKVLKAIIKNKDKHQYLLDCFSIIEKNIGIDNLKKWIKLVEEWSKIRNEIIHASFGKNIDSLNSALEKCARDGEKLSKDIKTFTNKIKDSKYQISVRTKWSAITTVSNENKDYCTDEFVYDKAYPFVLDKDDEKVKEIISFDILNPSLKKIIDFNKDYFCFIAYFFDYKDKFFDYEGKFIDDFNWSLTINYALFKKRNCHYFLKIMYLKLIGVFNFCKEIVIEDFKHYKKFSFGMFAFNICYFDKKIKYNSEFLEFARKEIEDLVSQGLVYKKENYESLYFKRIIELKNNNYEVNDDEIDYYGFEKFEFFIEDYLMYIDADYYEKEFAPKYMSDYYGETLFDMDKILRNNELYNMSKAFIINEDDWLSPCELLAMIINLNPQVRNVYMRESVDLNESFEEFMSLYISLTKKIEKIKEKYDFERIKSILRKVWYCDNCLSDCLPVDVAVDFDKIRNLILNGDYKDDDCYSICDLDDYITIDSCLDVKKMLKCLEYMEKTHEYLEIDEEFFNKKICRISKEGNNYILDFHMKKVFISEILSSLNTDKVFFESKLKKYYYKNGKVLIDEIYRIKRW